MPRSCCCRRAASSGAAASCWRHTSGVAAACWSRPGRRRRRGRRRGRSAAPSITQRQRRRPAQRQHRRSRALAPADVRHPVFQRVRRRTPRRSGSCTLRPDRDAIARTGCQTLARFTTGEARSSSARGRRAGAGARVGSRQRVERFSAARDVRAVPARSRALSGRRRGPARPSIWSATCRPGVAAAARGCVRCRRRPAAAAGGSRSTSIRRKPIPARLSVDEFQTAVTRLKDAAGSTARRDDRQQEDGSTCGSTCWR